MFDRREALLDLRSGRGRSAMDSGFTSSQVVEFTGITLRQLQWWDERGMVVPRRQGHRRLYSLEDLAEIAVICELRQRGLSLQRVRKVMGFLQRELGKRLYESASANSQIHLLTDGKNIFIKDSPESIVDVLKNSRQPILAVCLSDTVQRIQAGIRVGSRESPSTDIDVANVRARTGRLEKHLAAGKARLSRASGE
jgi:DNA-binding transcriptional MerR regulator